MKSPSLLPEIKGPEDDLFEAVLHLRHAFLLAGLQPPASIELASWEEGMKVLGLARTRYRDRYRRSLYGRNGTAEPITEIDVSGTTIRWPEQRWHRPAADVEDI